MSNNADHLLTLLHQQADLTDRLTPHCNWPYKSTQRLILDRGILFKNNIKSPFKGESNQCYKNSFQTLLQYPNLYYCEGFAAQSDIDLTFAHAWLTNDKGQVIDPTWWKKKDNINCVYFGVVFNTEFVMEMAEKFKVYSILENDFRNDHQLKKQGFPQHALASQFHPLSTVLG